MHWLINLRWLSLGGQTMNNLLWFVPVQIWSRPNCARVRHGKSTQALAQRSRTLSVSDPTRALNALSGYYGSKGNYRGAGEDM